MKLKSAPLTSSFTLTAIIGFVISWLYVLPQSLDFGVTFMIFFGVMVAASILNMVREEREQ